MSRSIPEVVEHLERRNIIMVSRNFLMVAVLSAASLFAHPIPASAQIATGVVAGVLLKDLHNKADHVIQSAQNAGDFLIWRAAQQALAVIEAWKKANSSLIDQAFDRLDDTTRQIFLDIDRSLDKMDKERELAVADAQRLTLQWAQIVKSFPLANREAEMLTYSPRVIMPEGEQFIDVQIFGPKLANSNPKMSAGQSDLSLKFSTETDGRTQLDRKVLVFEQQVSSRKILDLEFTQSKGLLNSTTVKREIPIWLAPIELGSYTIAMTTNVDNPERSEVNLSVGARGKDRAEGRSVSLPPDLTSKGWEIDIDKVVNPRAGWIHDLGGDHGTCSYVDRNSITKTSFVFVMELGHVNKGGSRRDAHQNCSLDVPIVRARSEARDLPALKGKLGWRDLEVVLPDKVASKRIEIKLFNGRSHIIADKGTTPLGLVSVDDRGRSVIFKPKPPSDF
jgi:hypothetical protein